MKYLSVCSGIEAATVAWHHMGWTPVGFSEIEKFPSAVLAHHYPSVPNLGDMTKHQEWNLEPVDLLVGGTPCQSFSVAGLRKGLDDPRGNLMLTYLAIADRYRPEWLVWENVPGVLSSNQGRDFGTLLGGLAELGYGFAYRILDAQYFGVAQRRRRVFVVANARDWHRAAAVLFERESLSGNPAPRRKTREGIAGGVAGGVELCGPLNARDYKDPGTDGMNHNSAKMVPIMQPVAFSRNDDGRDATVNLSPTMRVAGQAGGNLGVAVMQPVAFEPGKMQRLGYGMTEDGSVPTLRAAAGDNQLAVAVGAFKPGQSAAARSIGYEENLSPSLEGGGGGNNKPAVHVAMQVRRLTPVECERLQGFPDGYTNIPWRKQPEAPDGPRYKALGNSMAVPVMRWIGERIAAVEAITQ